MTVHPHDGQIISFIRRVTGAKLPELADGHREFSQREIIGKFHVMRRAFGVVRKFITFVFAHDKFAGGQFRHERRCNCTALGTQQN